MSRNALGAAALGAAALVWGGYTYRQAQASEAWPTVAGTVIQSGLTYATTRDRNVPDARRERTLDLKYRYRVEGRSYESRVISWSDDDPLALLWSRQHDEDLASRYPRGAPVTVHYDPADPARAVLEAGGGLQSMAILLAGLAAIGYAAWESRRG